MENLQSARGLLVRCDTCIRWSQGCGQWSSQARRVVLNAGGEWGTFLPTTSYPYAPWKTTADRRGAGKWNRGNHGLRRSSESGMADTEAERKQRAWPFGGGLAADGGIKILIAFWLDFVKGGGQVCGFSRDQRQLYKDLTGQYGASLGLCHPRNEQT